MGAGGRSVRGRRSSFVGVGRRSWALGRCPWALGFCSWPLGCRSQAVGFVRLVGLFVPAGLSFVGVVVMCRVLGGHR